MQTVSIRVFDSETGEEVATPIEDVRQAIRDGRMEFTSAMKQQLRREGVTQEQLESWLADKDS
jgi:chemotaxis protein histidine kinase CheA